MLLKDDMCVLFSARHCSHYYQYYYKNKTANFNLLMVVGCTECSNSSTIWTFMWQINKMTESQGSRRGCVFMIRAAMWRIYAQTNVTALIICICLFIYQTERCIASCWMWGNEKKNIEKKCNKSQIYSCSGPVRQTSIVVSGSTKGLIWVSWVNKSTWQSERWH